MKVGDYAKIGRTWGLISKNGEISLFETGFLGKEKIVSTQSVSSITDITLDNDDNLRVYFSGGFYWIADECSENEMATFFASINWV